MIDTTKFKPLKNRWQDIFKHLENKGYAVYSPGVKLGDCTFKYLVVKFEGSTRLAGISTDDDLYSVLCYVPQQNYSELDSFVQDVRRDMKELEPMILPYGSNLPAYYDDAVHAHYVALEFKNHKKL